MSDGREEREERRMRIEEEKRERISKAASIAAA
jgi:hypothetical protein